MDYQIFNSDVDGKIKLDHVHEMLCACIASKGLAFTHVLFDSGYATKGLMLLVESMQKRYYCPLKSNRQINDSTRKRAYYSLDWSEYEYVRQNHQDQGISKTSQGETVSGSDFNKPHGLGRDKQIGADSTQEIQDAYAPRWKIEQFHREIRQLTGMEKCQCRKPGIQTNHIARTVLIWI